MIFKLNVIYNENNFHFFHEIHEIQDKIRVSVSHMINDDEISYEILATDLPRCI